MHYNLWCTIKDWPTKWISVETRVRDQWQLRSQSSCNVLCLADYRLWLHWCRAHCWQLTEHYFFNKIDLHSKKMTINDKFKARLYPITITLQLMHRYSHKSLIWLPMIKPPSMVARDHGSLGYHCAPAQVIVLWRSWCSWDPKDQYTLKDTLL